MQNRVNYNAMTLLADKPTVVFFGVYFPANVHYADCCLVRIVKFARITVEQLLTIKVATRLRLGSVNSKLDTNLANLTYSYPSDHSKFKQLKHVMCCYMHRIVVSNHCYDNSFFKSYYLSI